MVAGHLQEKNGIYYMVLSYPSANGKRKNKWISTKLPVKGNKKKAEKMLSEIRQTFVPVDKVDRPKAAPDPGFQGTFAA